MEESIKKIDGVNDAVVSFMTQKMIFVILFVCEHMGSIRATAVVGTAVDICRSVPDCRI